MAEAPVESFAASALTETELCKKLSDPETGVAIRDRTYHLRLYKSCFVAREAVDWMLERGLAATRQEAVDVGNKLVAKALICHVTGGHDFEDGYFFFNVIPEALAALAVDLRRNVAVKVRWWKSRAYGSCFVGNEAVDWMVRDGRAQSREQAAALGQQLLSKAVITHVVGEHPFRDEELFFTFTPSALKWDAPSSEREIQGGRLADLPESPNCVSSLTYPGDSERYLPPLAYPSPPYSSQVRKLLKQVAADEGWALHHELPNYLHYQVTSPILRIVDDIEFLCDNEVFLVHVRSASRSTLSDLGATRKRMTRFAERWIEQTVALLSPAPAAPASRKPNATSAARSVTSPQDMRIRGLL